MCGEPWASELRAKAVRALELWGLPWLTGGGQAYALASEVADALALNPGMYADAHAFVTAKALHARAGRDEPEAWGELLDHLAFRVVLYASREPLT